MILCACGCGQETKIGKNSGVPNKYIVGHQNIGIPRSEETKQRISKANSGENNPNYGKKFSEEYRQKLSEVNLGENNPNYGKQHTEKTKKKMSATKQGITYEEWEEYAINSPYCPAFDYACKESNRDKYNRRCFICGLHESENISSTGKLKKLSVHHVDMDKQQGCNGKRWKLIPTCMHHHNLHNDLWIYRVIYLLECEKN